jgi:hypothetical protein
MLGLVASALADQSDVIFVGANVLTGDSSSSKVEAVALAGERILGVGDNKGIRRLAGPKTRIIDLHGRTVIPGLMDTHVVVAGAGAFGGWTALHLLRMGAQVTVVDAWGPGNSRASSGGETRIIRATYGPDKIYFEMVKRALEILRESERRWNRRLYHNIGCLVFPALDDTYARSSLPLFKEVGLTAEEISPAQAAKRWPQINFKGIRTDRLAESSSLLCCRGAATAPGPRRSRSPVAQRETRRRRREAIALGLGRPSHRH